VYLPADALNNAFGDGWTENVVNSILPYIGRSSRSPGLFNQPILDCVTLSALFFAPAAAMRTTIASQKRRGVADRDDSSSSFDFRKNSA
jgi:hypothetical protein